MIVLAYSTPSVLTEPEPTTITVAVVGFKKFASILSSFPSITIRQIFSLAVFPKAVNAADATGTSIVGCLLRSVVSARWLLQATRAKLPVKHIVVRSKERIIFPLNIIREHHYLAVFSLFT